MRTRHSSARKMTLMKYLTLMRSSVEMSVIRPFFDKPMLKKRDAQTSIRSSQSTRTTMTRIVIALISYQLKESKNGVYGERFTIINIKSKFEFTLFG